MYSVRLQHAPIDFEAWLKNGWDSAKSAIARRLREERNTLRDPVTFALNACAPGRYVLKLGDGARHLAGELKRKLCRVSEAELMPTPIPRLPDNVSWFDEILLLGVLEELPAPAIFMQELRRRMPRRGSEVVITTQNTVTWPTRLMLACARLADGGRTKLADRRNGVFSFKKLRNLLRQTGYEVIEARGLPMAFDGIVRDTRWTRVLSTLNAIMVKFAPHLFADQICVRARPVRPAIGAETTPAPAPAMAYSRLVRRAA